MYTNRFDRILEAISDSLILRLAICAPIAVCVVYGCFVLTVLYMSTAGV